MTKNTFNNNTDRDWEKYGKDDPYFGVVSQDKFQNSNLTSENKKEFFQSGADRIDNVLENIRQNIDPNFTIKKGLDFGCGVGRLVIPLAKVAEEVTGIDVSDSMLNEAKKNCEERSINNVVLTKSDDNLSSLKGKYNFIHSFIVFQHIPVNRGERIFENLLARLESGGIGVVHFTYARQSLPMRYLLGKYVPLFNNLINLLKGRNFSYPQMQMNTYDLNRLFLIMQKANILNCYTELTDHEILGIVIYFKKP